MDNSDLKMTVANADSQMSVQVFCDNQLPYANNAAVKRNITMTRCTINSYLTENKRKCVG